MNRNTWIEGAAFLAAVAAGAGVAAGAVALARGETTGAPGITKGLARIGRLAGGRMLTGVSLVGGSAALIGIAVHQGLKQFER